MGKSTNGPDWIDVENMMRVIGSLHSGKVGLTFLPRGIGGTGGLEVGANIAFDVLPGSSIPEQETIIKHWPCASHETLSGHCFALLLQLDYQVGKIYQNEALWS